jgi:hypothetical protein
MRKVFLIVGAAALAASMPALAQKGGHGGGGGGGHGGGGGGPAAHGNGGGGGGGGKPAHGGGNGHGGGQAARAAPAQFQAPHGGGGGHEQKAMRQAPGGGQARQAGGGHGNNKHVQQHAQHVQKPAKAERNAFRQTRRAPVQQVIYDTPRGDDRDRRTYGGGDYRYADSSQSCPPGLAKKGNGCMPPGQAKKRFAVGAQVQQNWFGGYNVPDRYSAFYPDTQDQYYRYDEGGYIYRVDQRSNLISGLVPLLGGGFGVGQQLPAGYDAYNVPYQYRDDYYDTDEANYRYGDDAIYQVDPQSGLIEGIVALLSGGGFNVGEAMPSGYDAYNLPMDYRDEYSDTDDANYRYADGNIYEVDPKTQIIQQIVEMLG